MDIGKQQNNVSVPALNAAHANEYFEQFVNASSMKHILGYYRGLMDSLQLRPNVFPLFYPKLKANLTSWRAKALLKKFDLRASHKCYQKGKVAANTRVLVIGGGPCGMRTAIEAQLLGAKVVVVEKRDRFSRNNVLHLWPFVIEDLRMLGAKKFFGKFCAGAIDHISIRQLQCILLKVALLLGVEIHTEVSFENLVEPDAAKKIGWRAEFKPSNHPVSQYEFDVIIGADGKRNTLQGFTRKEFRGKLAIAITANFINKKTEAEARVEEISGVAFIFNQKFFKDLQEATRIDLENIVYYKDDTHYFVMTAKKHSLIEKGVIKQDFPDTERLLAPENVDKEALQQYAIEAATFSTNYQMENLEFAVNHYGQPDIAMFDFTSMYAAENASKVLERDGYRLLKILVGDSLLEPFWPTGSGCARGFLSSLDAAWAIRTWSLGTLSPLDTMAERESIYRLLAQTTPDNLNKDWKSYTLDPATRYPNLNKAVVLPHQVICLYETDNPASIERMKRTSNEKPNEIPKKRRRGIVDNEVLLNWLKDRLKDKGDINITDLASVFREGKALCAIINHYRPDLLDSGAIKTDDPASNNQMAIDILEKDLCVPPVMTGGELTVTEDYLTMATYLTEVYDCFRGEIPYIKHPRLKQTLKIPHLLKVKYPCTFLNPDPQPTKITCSKCFKAYHSKASFYPGDTENLFNSISQNVVVPSKSPKVRLEKDFEASNKNAPKQIPTKIRKRKKKTPKAGPSSEKIIPINSTETKTSVIINTGKSLNNFSNQLSTVSLLKPSSEIDDNEEDIQRKYIEKIYSKNVKLKKFLTGLWLKRKLSSDTKENHSVSETKKNNGSKINDEESALQKPDVNFMHHPSLCINQKSVNGNQVFTLFTTCVNSSVIAKPLKLNNMNTILGKKNCEDKFTCTEPLHLNFNENSSTDTKANVTFGKTKYEHFQNSIKDEPLKLDSYKNAGTKTDIDIIFDKKNYKDKFTSTEKLIRCDKFAQVDSSMENIKERYFNRKARSKFTLQTIHCLSDRVTISSKVFNRSSYLNNDLPNINKDLRQFQYGARQLQTNYSQCDFFKWEKNNLCENLFQDPYERQEYKASEIHSKVSKWISSSNFFSKTADKTENITLKNINAVSKLNKCKEIKIEERTDFIKFPVSSGNDLNQKTCSQGGYLDKQRNSSKSVKSLVSQPISIPPPIQISTIPEVDEVELPVSNTKLSEVSFKTIKTGYLPSQPPELIRQVSRPSSRHKHKHDAVIQKATNVDRKPRKRRTLERIGANIEERQKILEEIANNRADRHSKRRYQRKLQTEQFLKSMQMLQANAKPDSQPFEDYSIFLYRQTAPKFEDRVKDLEKQFTYIADHEHKPNQFSRISGRDEDIAAKIKHLENKWRQPQTTEKKPKDLLRAIGKIETSDWNIKEIEKKILENKLGKPSKAIDKEKVPKWSKEQFVARQTKMEKQHLDRQNSGEAKFADIDRNIKNLDQKLKEGTVREMGTKKVASITEKLVSKIPAEAKPLERNIGRQPVALPMQAASEFCHFCNKRVYLMERLSAEGKFFHHGCFKCQYCHIQLRLGSYAFDRDGIYGNKFYCVQHFGMPGEIPVAKVQRKPSVKRQNDVRRSPEKRSSPGLVGVDSIDKIQTPERIEFSNLSTGHISSDQEDSLNQMDEDEWTDKNFGGSCAELDDTDDDSSSISDTDSDDEGAFDDALEEPATKEGTLKWAERWKNSYSQRRNSDSNEYSSSSDQSSYYDSSDDDESETATEGEEEIRARELRKKEVCVEPPIVHTDTGTDTEVVSDESSSESSNQVHNSATEISTDSEFAQDDPTPTRELPSILLNDFHVTKTRGGGGHYPKKIQVTSRYLQKPSDGKLKKPNIELKLSPLVKTVKKPAPIALARPEGYVLNRTQSTGGIAAKVSLELKKKYLLGEPGPGNIQKSGSASTLDTKFKSFHTNISDCQKLLKPSTEISASMQTFCKKLNELKSPVSPQTSIILTREIEEPEEKEVEETEIVVFENEPEGRPRSPVYETSIMVPQIDWSKQNNNLTSDSLASSDSDNGTQSKSKAFENIPRVEIFTAQDNDEPHEEFVPDSLHCPEVENINPKSVTSEKKALNQPKILPNLENLLPEIHNSLHNKYKKVETVLVKDSSVNLSSPESAVTTALTETELSDWARDEVVSDDFEDGVFEISFKQEQTTDNKPDLKDKVIITEAMNSILSVNLDNIEFMDTGTETSSDDGIVNSQNGYVLFKNEDEFAADSLTPHINDILEAKNVHVMEDYPKNLKEIEETKPDDDDVAIIESGTTTEENTFTESTVKNVIDLTNEVMLSENNNLNEECKHSDQEITIVNDVESENKDNFDNNIEFQEHCQRLKSKVEFSNAKDSIDIRKSRRKSKPDVLSKQDLISEEIPSPVSSPKSVALKFHSPDNLYNKEVIKKERDTNQKLIQEMVMNKMRAENKSLERRKRIRQTPSPNLFVDLKKSASTTAVISPNHPNNVFSKPEELLLARKASLKSANVDFINSETIYSSPIRKNLDQDQSETPKAPPRYNKKSEDMDKKLEKLKQTVRLRNKENEQLLLNKQQLNSQQQQQQQQKKDQVARRCISDHFDSVPVRKQESTARAKSVADFAQKVTLVQCNQTADHKFYKSDPNMLESNEKSRRKSQDRENRKSLTKIIAGFFTKKSPSSPSKGLFSKLSPTKSKEISKEPVIYQQRKSLSENFINRNVTPPPVPPLPINYVRKTDDSSDGEEEFKKHHDSSCDTLDFTGASVGSAAARRSSKSLKAARQAQLKRHRMAQEIQRKLEETEVKTKELEDRGVLVEKALRGERSSDSPKDEAGLLQEWFDLMRDRTELRRYERELTVKAQELELEDRHARLQHELRERIEDDKPKSQDDVEVEESIINEMIKIVEKRDSLIRDVEEDNVRYSHENRDLEEQMLAKGLRLTSVKNSPEH